MEHQIFTSSKSMFANFPQKNLSRNQDISRFDFPIFFQLSRWLSHLFPAIKIRLSHLFPSIFQLHDFAAIRFPSHGIPSAFSWDPRTRSNLWSQSRPLRGGRRAAVGFFPWMGQWMVDGGITNIGYINVSGINVSCCFFISIINIRP